MKNYFSLIVFICVVAVHLTVPAISLYAQQRDSSKANRLDSVTVTAFKKNGPAELKRFSPGTNVISYSGEAVKKMQSASLADFIKAENAAYIKEYGRGMNAFLSIRGTSSSHTTIDWNGQNMSLPTMGQADLSHIPLYFFDAMDIHIGGGSALYGDGSIGGTVKLKTGAKWISGQSGDISLTLGSFGSIFTGATYRYSGAAVDSRSSVLFNRALNNYTFENNTKPGRPRERLNNSAISNWGAIQE
ncbi:MAG: Plug domain-containing protein, partial [Bacteroidales bacterium]|nr:Plug domain-containing protein [Bacteroidales bacterium]